MIKKIQLKITPAEAASDTALHEIIANQESIDSSRISGFVKTHQSIDARNRQVWINMTLNAYIDEPFTGRTVTQIHLQQVSAKSKSAIIIGAGPAGLFAALKLIENGIRPIVVERGKDVKSRRRDLAALNKTGVLNPDSNYCFGEGGAGTYSDGKLYTRSNKRGNIDRILNIFVQFGANEEILFKSHPHIGTNKLPQIITAMREAILAHGGEVHFDSRVTDFIIQNNQIVGVKTAQDILHHADAVILATGHSARDIFELLHQKNILIEPKPFALGVRIEHPQALINQIQYHCTTDYISDNNLPPASYSLVEQVNNRGLFSFCMCPGGIIAPASTSPNELVVNGWSPSKRNNPYANSGMVVSVNEADATTYFKQKGIQPKMNPLLLLHFQSAVEQAAYKAGGGNFVAPAQRMVDFCSNKLSNSLPECSYIPGITSTYLNNVLPGVVASSLQQGLKVFGKKMKGYYTNEAILVATESRTSSPIRIPRNVDDLQHPQIKNLYPCGEGAGYAGGIVSAAMDGEKVAEKIIQQLKN